MTDEIARNKTKDTDVAEMHTESGKSQKRKGDRPAGSPEMSAGKIERTIASETAVETETAALGQIGARGGPGKTTDPGTTKTGRIVDPTVAMMRTSALKESGDNALTIGTRPVRVAPIAAPNTDRPERKEAGETAVGPQHNNGGKNAQLIVRSPGQMTVPRPGATPDLPLCRTAQEREDRQPGAPQSRKQCQQQWSDGAKSVTS